MPMSDNKLNMTYVRNEASSIAYAYLLLFSLPSLHGLQLSSDLFFLFTTY